MNQLTPRQVVPADAPQLITWLCASRWPYHVDTQPTPDSVRRRIEGGAWWGDSSRAFWLEAPGVQDPVGLVALQELDDPTPIFDLRIAETERWRGWGGKALRWLARYTFTETDKLRLEAHTRADNLGMRRALTRADFVQEAHHRLAWPDAEGAWHDATTYAVLRGDWERGVKTPVPCYCGGAGVSG